MPLVSSSIPNLINGVSQQPAPTRLRTSCEAAENAYMSVVSGLQKRPNATYMSTLGLGNIPTDTAIHVIKKSGSDKYVIVAGNGTIQVFDIETGNGRTVIGDNADGYLTTTKPASSFRFVTIADTTFVLNREITVQGSVTAETGDRLNPYNRVSVFIKRAVASTTYAVYVNNSLAATTGTNANTEAANALEGTAEIAEEMRADCAGRGYSNVGVVGSTLYFDIPVGAVVTVTDQFGGAAMRVIQDKIQEFSDLPPSEREGRLVKVMGDADESGDDYWVYFDGQVWVETHGWDAKYSLNDATMMHTLVDQGDGTFDYGVQTYIDRLVGDDDSNALPSFVNNPINSMFLYKGRMGLLSDENLIMSETNNYENYFRTTVTQLLDTERIDVASTTGRINYLQHAVAFGDNLVLFSDKQQFKVTQGDTITPQTVGLQPTTAFDSSIDVQPVSSGPNVFFAVDGPTWASMRELYIDSDNDQFNASLTTVQVPKYIPTGITGLTVSTFEDIMVALSKNDLSTLYIYKWFVDGNQKVQSAWSKWTFDDIEIIGIRFVDQDLIMVYKMGGDVHVSRVRVEETVSVQSDSPLLIDHKLTRSLTTTVYDAITDTTTITVPYSYANTLEFWRQSNPYGDNLVATKVNNSTYTVSGDETLTDWAVGVPYTFSFEVSQQYIRGEAGGGEVAIQDGRVQLRYMSVLYQNSSYFVVEVKPTNRNQNYYVFTGRIFASSSNILDTMPFDTGEFRFPVMSKNTEVVIKLTSDKPFPCAFGSIEWDAMYYPRTKRI